MAAEAHHHALSKKLRDSMVEIDGKKEYLPDAELKNILTQSELEKLFKKAWDIWGRKDKENIEDIMRRRLKVLATILLHNQKSTLKTFISWYKSNASGLLDNDFPHSQKDCEKSGLGPTFAAAFHDEQYLFNAAIFQDGKENYVQNGRREPIVNKPRILGTGYSGTVYAVTIAPGHLLYENDERKTYPRPMEFARKVFGGEYRNPDSAGKDYEQERDIHIKLKELPNTSNNLLYWRFSVVEKSTKDGRPLAGSLFYDRATCNLGEVLTRDNVSKASLIRQIRNITLAMMILHSEDYLHRDLKPDNVLCFGNSETATFLLKIADYGFATEIPFQKGTQGGSVSGRVPRAEFQGPEVHHGKTDRVGWWTDDWSLACIVLCVLAYLDDGKDGVNMLMKNKNNDRDDKTHETFFETKKDASEPVELVAGVRKYCDHLKTSFRGRNAGGGDIVSNLITFLQDKMFVAPETRRTNGKDALSGAVDRFVKEYEDISALAHSSIQSAAPNEPPLYGNRPSSDITRHSPRTSTQTQYTLPLPNQAVQELTSQINESFYPPTRTSCIPLCRAVRKLIKESEKSGTALTDADMLRPTNLLLGGESPTQGCPRHGGMSPLNFTIFRENIPILQVLLDHGEQINLTQSGDLYGRSPLALAGFNGNYEVCEQLLKYMRKEDQPVRMSDFLSSNQNSENRSKIEGLIEKYRV